MVTQRNGNPNAEERTVDVVIIGAGASGLMAVSYTHLTLPTILLV